ncbi:hypothetical protein F5984_09920 [Rudanella paleaurantiibacter]|uniref:Ig-like domain-containing protein n=1 Tax=Rudanella paleaurantiibacter TaxID=2614655 RepID=A0A7J5U0B6_9BACT|nr:choice-of-anchor Q domain-containing protein [Rudanella paleaurantiibacter]KAB7731119.1 hypothetical protein F5984_09920 [Rudanella paleaurantiibacter]
MKHIFLFCFRLLIILLFGIPLTGQAQTIRYVKATASGNGSGSSWANASGDLQAMINASSANDQVWVAAGVYKPTSSTNPGVSFSMKDGVKIYGGFVGNEQTFAARPQINPVLGQPSSTTLSGDIDGDGTLANNSYHVIKNSRISRTAILDGFVITGGNAVFAESLGADAGGAIYNDQGSPSLTNCSIQNNQAYYAGGGIYNGNNSSPGLLNCMLQANNAFFGGAICNEISSAPILTNCILQNNLAGSYGGAMFNRNNSSPILTNCSLEGNRSENEGGAIFSTDDCSPALMNCTLRSNQGGAGQGVIFNDRSTTYLSNCVVFGNGGPNTIINSNGSAEAVYCLFDDTVTGYTSDPTNLTTTVSPFVSATGIALNACSPAINAGSPVPSNVGNIDLVGNPRIAGTRIDMGAVEFQGTARQPVTIITQPLPGTSVLAGSVVTAGLSASGTTPISYQWYKNTELVSGQNSATLSLTNVQPTDAGKYVVVGTNACNSLTSTAFSLSVTEPFSIIPASVFARRGIAAQTTTLATLTRISSDPASLTATLNGGSSVTNNGVTISGVINNSGTITADITATCGAIPAMFILHVTDGIYSRSETIQVGLIPSVVPLILEEPASYSLVQPGATVTTSFEIRAGDPPTYQWYRGSTALRGQGSSTLTLTNVQASATGTYYAVATAGCVSLTSNTFSLSVNAVDMPVAITITPVEPLLLSVPEGGSVVNRTLAAVTTTSPANLTVTINGSTSATLNGVSVTDLVNTNGTIQANLAAACGASSALFTLMATNGTVSSSALVRIGVVRTLPVLSITSQPVATSSVQAGASVMASVSAVSGNPISYQWYKDGQPVTGQTSAMLSLTNVRSGSSGTYVAVLTSGCQSVTSTAFTLQVEGPPTRLYVRANASGANTGLSWQDAFTDLQSALNYSDDTDLVEIWVAAGLYKPTNGSDRSRGFVMKPNVAVYGGFTGTETRLSERPAIHISAPSATTLSGDIGQSGNTADNSYHVVTTPTGSVAMAVLDGFVLTGGNANGNETNQFDRGGGVYSAGMSLTVRNCAFVGLSAREQGGGICVEGGSLVVQNSWFNSNNGGLNGGAVFNGGNAQFVNCSFFDNRAVENGGAFFNTVASSVAFLNCSFHRNQAADGGAVTNAGTALLTNCVLWSNGLVGNGRAFTFNGNVTVNYSLLEVPIFPYEGSNNIIATVSPFVSPTSTQITGCSPAVNAGDPATPLATVGSLDLAGNARLFGTQLDMGAFEFQSAPQQVVGITSQPMAGTLVSLGAVVTASVSVSGTGPYTYQWFRNGQIVGDQTSATLSLTNVQPTDGGIYRVVVSSACNSVTSTAFSLSVVVSRLYVRANASGANTGLSWQDAYTDLQTALTNAQISAAEIWVAGGVYKPTTSTNRNVSFVFRPGMRLYGGFNGTETDLSQRPVANLSSPSSTTLSGDIGLTGNTTANAFNDNSYHVVVGQTGLSQSDVLDGFVITRGTSNILGIGLAGGFGGGLYIQGAGSGQVCSPTVRNCWFVDNRAVNGGAVCNDASNGGTSSPIFVNCLFEGNGASSVGGALSNYAPQNGFSNTQLVNCSFVNNGAVEKGGAVYNALYTAGSQLTLLNCSMQNGGTVYNEEVKTRLQLTNCLLWDTFERPILQSAITANYCLFRKNETNYSGVGNVVSSYSPFESATSTKLVNVCSQALNAGDPATTVEAVGTTDGFGNPRIVDGRIDIGAYEVQLSPPSATRLYVNASATGASTGLSWADAFTNLQAALAYPCEALREIWVAGGSYRPAAGTSFAMRPNVVVYGGFIGTETEPNQRPAINLTTPSSTTLLGNGQSIISNGPGLTETAILDGFVLADNTTISNGADIGNGAGITNDGSGTGNVCLPQIRKCWFVNNTVFNGKGGAIYNKAGNGGRSGALIRECVFVNNRAKYGGAIHTDSDQLVVENSVFRANNATSQGAAIFFGDGTVLISKSLFEEHANVFTSEGTVFSNGTATIDSCVFRKNTGNYAGLLFQGAYIQISNSQFIDLGSTPSDLESVAISRGRVTNSLFLRIKSQGTLFHSGEVTVDKCRFEKNEGSVAGAIWSLGDLKVSNSLFTENSSDQFAGVFDGGSFRGGSGDKNASFTNCVFTNNRGGIYGKIFTAGNSTSGKFINCSFQGNYTENYIGVGRFPVALENCVFGGNKGQSPFVSDILTASYCVLENGEMAGISGANNIVSSTSPFASTSSAELSACSPAINAGDPATTTATVGTTDFAGNPRFVGGRIDAGAFEFQGGVQQPLAIVSQPAAGTVVPPGGVATTSISVTGGGPISVQWYKGGTLLIEQTSTTLSLSNVQPTDAGNYSAVVTDGCSSLTSNGFNLEVTGLNDVSVCAGQSVSLTATGGVSYTLLNTGLSNATGIFTVSPSSTTTFTIIVGTSTGTQLTQISRVTVLEQHPDYAPLADLYRATNGMAWLNRTGWLASCDPCSGWYGVSCQNGRVVSLSLSANGLVGLLPASLPGLTQLQHLNLSNNQLQGCFPASLTALCSLSTKSFAGNAGLPNGGDFDAFCERGAGSDALLVSLAASRDRVCVGDGVVLEARVQGTGPFSYQWYSGALLLSGETGPRLELGNLRRSTSYRVVVLGSCPAGGN